MSYKLTEINGFLVAGIAARTTNVDGKSQYDIGELWGKFMTDQLAGQISKRLTNDIYCVYTEYESDHTGYYTALLGCRVSSVEGLPGGFVSADVPGGKFRVYQPEGELPQSVGTTWRQIWEEDIERSYQADFDIYYAPDAAGKPQVEVYLGVR